LYYSNKGDVEMANKRLGEILRNLRNEHNLTQQQVANMLGLKNKSTLGSWEVGKSEPDGYTFLKLCSLYGVDNIYDTFNDIGDFNVPTSKNTFYTSPEEQQLILAYRSADEIDKTIVKRTLKMDAVNAKNTTDTKIS
jgi:transcriptional regulator with XRE-family HTH domain